MKNIKKGLLRGEESKYNIGSIILLDIVLAHVGHGIYCGKESVS